MFIKSLLLLGGPLHRMSLRTLTAIVFVGVLLTTGALAYVNFSANQDRGHSVDTFGTELEKLRLYNQAHRAVLEESVLTVVYLTLQRQEFIDDFELRRAEATSTFVALQQHLATNDPSEVQRVTRFRAQHAQVSAAYAQFLALLRDGDRAGALVLLADADLEATAQALVEELAAAAEEAQVGLTNAQVAGEATEGRWDWITLAIAGAWGGVLLLGSFVTFRWVIQPVRRLESVSRSIADGEVDVRAPETGPAEIASLSANINQMADALITRSEELNAYLAQNLEARTEELERANVAITESEHRFRALVQNASDMIVILDREGKPTYASPAVERIMGYLPEEIKLLNVLSLVHPDDVEGAGASLAAVAEQPGVHPATEVRIRHKDGSWRLIELVALNLLDEPAIQGIVYNARDVTARRAAEEAIRQSEERFRSLVQNASDMITVIEADTTVVYQSPSIEQMLGYAPDDVLGRKLSELIHPDDVGQVALFLRGIMSHPDRSGSIDARLRHRDGAWRYVEIVGADQRDNAGLSGFVLNTRDLSERKQLEEQLRHQAFHDPLTNLANRARFTDRLTHGLDRARQQSRTAAVLFMDIDNFKSINDSLGHGVGDRILIDTAGRIRAAVRPGDTVARLGGDEFAILLDDATLGEATDVATRILDTFQVPFEVTGRHVQIGASIGIALSEDDDSDAEALLRNADVAMYVAKDRGKGRYEIYERRMHAAMVERLELLSDLQRALDHDELVVYYQPTVALRTGKIVGMEALVRWRHPEQGLLLPQQFIQLAEESGLIYRLGRWVLSQACHQAKDWQERFPSEEPWSMGVNVSPKQVQQAGFVDEVIAALDESGLPPTSLILEITESTMMADVDSTVARLQHLRDLGVRIAIDDFGTGYSSLSYLRQFPFDIIKIDRSFVDASDDGGKQHELARAIVELGRSLHASVVAEGIDRADQLAHLRALDCDLGQGFYFARPGEVAQIEELLRRRDDSTAAA